MSDHYQILARYNAWANLRLYDAASELSEHAFRADRGAFFKSVQGTLNHLLVTDRIWLHRFTGEGEATNSLDAILFETLPDLRAARIGEDARLLRYVEGLDAAALAGVFRYRRASTPDIYEQALAPALDHLFNHHAHHRGQVHALLTGLIGSAPVLDLLAFQRAFGIGGMKRVG